MSAHGPAKRPCGSCPYRKDCPSGLWAEEEYDKLPRYDEPGSLAVAFFCHRQDGRLCAGWCGCHDMEDSVGLRIACATEIIGVADVEAARDYVSPVPLWESGAAAAEHGKREIYVPGPKARRAIARLHQKLDARP